MTLNKCLPVVRQAARIFEQKTGIYVIGARAYTKGSMRPYVHFRLQLPHEGLHNDHMDCARAKKDHYLNGVKITFVSTAFTRRELPEFSEVDIDWKDLGMEYPF